MCVYVCVPMWVRVCMWVQVCMHVCVHLCAHMYTSVRVYACACMHTLVCMRACVYVCMHVCACVFGRDLHPLPGRWLWGSLWSPHSIKHPANTDALASPLEVALSLQHRPGEATMFS